MSKPSDIVTNDAIAAAEPRFVAPELIETGPAGPRLVAGKCVSCGALSFPKAAVCADCLSVDIATSSLSSEGVLYAFSIVHQAPTGWTVPYALGYVDLPEGVRVLAHIETGSGDEDLDSITIDSRVRLGVGRVGTDAGGAALLSYVFSSCEGGRS